MCYCVCKPKRTVLNQLINTCMNDWSNLVVWEIYTCIIFALSVGVLVRKAKGGGNNFVIFDFFAVCKSG